MRFALIDLGTNSVRFDVHQIGPGTKIRSLHREKIMVRLGQGVFATGQLDRTATQRTIRVLESFNRICRDLQVTKIVAIATSALREAADSQKFVDTVKKATGIEFRVISGTEEARLIARGILANQTIKEKKFGLIDIGGGSTEISTCKQKKVTNCHSFRLGTARLQQMFLQTIPPKHDDVEKMRRYIRQHLILGIRSAKIAQVDTIIGSSGTVRALLKILKKRSKHKYIDYDDLCDLNKQMSKMTTSQLLSVSGMEPKRVDMILSGSVLLEEAMDALDAEKVIPSEFSLRDGLLVDQLQLLKRHQKSELAIHFDDLIDKVVRLGGDKKRLHLGLKTTESVFKALRHLHKLKPEWLVYIKAAMILRNCGEIVSLVNHAEHSYYIIKNAHFPFIDDWEAEFVASLCRLHERAKLEPDELPFKDEPGRRRTFLKALGVLAFADALDCDFDSAVQVKRARAHRKNLSIMLSVAGRGHKNAMDDGLRLEQRSALFVKTLGVSIQNT